MPIINAEVDAEASRKTEKYILTPNLSSSLSFPPYLPISLSLSFMELINAPLQNTHLNLSLICIWRVRRAQINPGEVSTPTKRAEAGRQARPQKREEAREAEEAEETQKWRLD